MATQDQLESRKEVQEFLERIPKRLRALGGKIKSEWFGRPDEELKGWIERGRAIEEIEDSLGYRLIMGQTERETDWALAQLEICEEKDVRDLRLYLRSLRFLKDFILTTKRNADISSSVLAGREGAIGSESHAFVKNARVEGS